MSRSRTSLDGCFGSQRGNILHLSAEITEASALTKNGGLV